MTQFSHTDTPDISDTPDNVSREHAGQELPESMRADVRLLGSLLGQVLRESGSAGLYEDVEQLRTATIEAYTDETPEAFARAAEIANSFSTERADEIARAFTCYFHLVNLAEEHHRVRVLRERDGAAEPEESADNIVSAFHQLAKEVGADTATQRLQTMRFHPVFTAHPTEARRRAVSTSIRRLSEFLQEKDRAEESGLDTRRGERRILEEIDTLWRTAPLRREKPSPTDEVRAVMAVFDDTLYRAIPQVYRRVDDALRIDEEPTAPLVRPFVRLGTWVGGDRDGNPFVTASVTRGAAKIASEHVLIGLERTATRVGRALTLDATTTPPSSAVTSLWQRLRSSDEDAAAEIAKRSPHEPHRSILLLLARKIAATRTRNADLGYAEPAELLSDLQLVQDSLIAAGAKRQAWGDLQQLIWQVQTFGFHLAELEVRQHSAVHARVLAELESGEQPSEQAEEVLEVFRAIAFLQKRYGPAAAGRYIVSFTQSTDDLTNVHRLARLAVGPDGTVPVLDVIPLFETFADLQAAPGILAEFAEQPEVVSRLASTGRRMEVMLGYSDSSKDVGPVAANLALYHAQAEITGWAHEKDIELTLFHGRGGALGRGGGPANSAILAQPPHSVDGRFKLTEQGEVIFARYGDSAIAMRHIDQVAGAMLMASAPSIQERNARTAAQFVKIAEVMDSSSRQRFSELVHAEGFASWFATVTPMEEVGLLALGSRPARRGVSTQSLDDLRAIPWVFAWTQARINLAGWFGLGTALAAVDDLELLQQAYQEWPLLRTLVDNVAMSLAKADARIARQYLALGDRDDLAEIVMGELELTQEWVIRVTGGTELLDNRPVLQRAVKMRSPYVDALSLLQLRALRALRGAADTGSDTGSDQATPDPQQQRLLLLSVSGVAAGLQNTG